MIAIGDDDDRRLRLAIPDRLQQTNVIVCRSTDTIQKSDSVVLNASALKDPLRGFVKRQDETFFDSAALRIAKDRHAIGQALAKDHDSRKRSRFVAAGQHHQIVGGKSRVGHVQPIGSLLQKKGMAGPNEPEQQQ